jgi:hypothetical protein
MRSLDANLRPFDSPDGTNPVPLRVGTISGGWENSGADSLNRRFGLARSTLYAKWEPRPYERLVKVATLATIPQCPTVLLQRQNQVRRSDSTRE